MIGSESERDGGITVGGGMRMVGRVAQKKVIDLNFDANSIFIFEIIKK